MIHKFQCEISVSKLEQTCNCVAYKTMMKSENNKQHDSIAKSSWLATIAKTKWTRIFIYFFLFRLPIIDFGNSCEIRSTECLSSLYTPREFQQKSLKWIVSEMWKGKCSYSRSSRGRCVRRLWYSKWMLIQNESENHIWSRSRVSGKFKTKKNKRMSSFNLPEPLNFSVFQNLVAHCDRHSDLKLLNLIRKIINWNLLAEDTSHTILLGF